MSDRPFVDFREVKAHISIPEVLDVLGIREQFTEKEGVLTGVCPFPDHSHGPKPNRSQFKINQKDGVWLWHCFGDCQAGGDVIELVKRCQGLSNEHVRFWFAEHFADRLTLKKGKDKGRGEQAEEKSVEKKTERQASGLVPLRFYLNLDTAAAESYLASRGISLATAKRYDVGMCGKGMFKGYLAMPVWRWQRESEGENPVGYVGRWPGEDFDEAAGRPRYKNGLDTGQAVYGLEQAEAAPGGQALLVVEGPLTVLWLADRGYPAVATFSATVTDKQADILVGTGRPVVLAFDGNEAGYEGMRKAAAKLITRSFVRVVKLPAGKEPDTVTDEELQQYFGPILEG